MTGRPEPDLHTLAQAMHDVCDRPQDFTADQIATVLDATIRGFAELPAPRRALVETALARRVAEAKPERLA